MGDKKNIDEFFQEHFKNFEANPPEDAWENIQKQLDVKESNKKVTFPFWFKYAGIAATLVFLISFLIFQYSSDVNQETKVIEVSAAINEETVVVTMPKQNTSDDSLGSKTTKDVNNPTANKNFKINNFSVATVSNGIPYNANAKQEANSNGVNKKSTDFYSNTTPAYTYPNLNKGGAIVHAKNKIKQTTKENIKNTTLDKSVATVNFSTEANSELMNYSGKGTQISTDKSNHKERVARTTTVAETGMLDTLTTSLFKDASLRFAEKDKETVTVVVTIDEEGNTQTVVENNDEKTQEGLSEIAQTGLIVIEEAATENNEEEEVQLPIEKTIEDAIAEQELTKDTEEEEKEEAESMYKKWNIQPTIAPVYYNSLASGSPIDSDLAGNKKKGQVTTSYGIGVGYAINKRLRIRTGVNKLEVGYDTEGVALHLSNETTGVKGVKNIAMSASASSMSIASATTYSASQIPESFSLLFDSSLNQRLGYLEVPVELSYLLTNKKLKVDVIAGMSSFFLNKNEIYTENNSMVTYIGEANNLNNTVYSTNIGFGFAYNISNGLNFNFEPMFKYQLNAFSNDSGNFKPYILGLYTGLSYKF